MQVSHFIDRNNIELAFDLNNTWLISEKSNVWDAKIPMEGYKSKHHYEYEMWLRKKIGNKKVNKMFYPIYLLEATGIKLNSFKSFGLSKLYW